jgi:DNA-directed RNA polymerase specialized sigma24 family protein
MPRRRGRAAGHGDQHADVIPDARQTDLMREGECSLTELEAKDDAVRRAADCLERRRHDQKLRDELAAEDFNGPLWRGFAEELVRYGHAVLLAWQRSGAIFVQCRRKHRSIGQVPWGWTDQDRIDLATETVARAITTFRKKALMGGGWTFEGGASLKTYFVGACVLAYPSIYRRWKTEHKAMMNQVFIGTAGELDGIGQAVLQSIGDPAEATMRRSEITKGLADLPDDRTRVAVMASVMGYTITEIAEILSDTGAEVTEGAVKQILHRHRRRTKGGETS